MAAPAGRASDKVYELLRREIDAGKVVAGQRLLEVDVAGRFGVSRTPVREALIRLAREGVLEKAERGFALPHADAAAFQERIDARRLLDVEIARLAAAAVRDGVGRTDALKGHVRRAESAHAAGRPRNFALAHYALRDAVRMLAGNRLLARCAALVDDSFRVGREQLYHVQPYRALTLDADRRLVDAIAEGDVAAAAVVTQDFLDSIAEIKPHVS